MNETLSLYRRSKEHIRRRHGMKMKVTQQKMLKGEIQYDLSKV